MRTETASALTASVLATFLSVSVGSARAQEGEPEDGWKTDLSSYIVHPDSTIRIGPPDGVPPIDDTKFVSPSEAEDWLGDREPVAVVSLGGITRAYPVQILMYHDIVNDWIGDRPVLVSFCILCGSSMAFDRRLDGQVLEFSYAGRLYNSNLVMYDRQTETWWGQAVGEGLVGEYAGVRLDVIPAPVMSFAAFRETWPDGEVLSRDTGYEKPYGKGRLLEYETDPNPIARIFRRETDKRLSAKERVLVIEDEDDIVAIPYEALAERPVIETEVSGRDYVVFWGPGTASIYSERTADGRDVGAAVAYVPELAGRRLTFEPAGPNRFRDEQTGSIWTLSGVATDGPLSGKSLEPAEAAVHFWFVWAAYRPETRVVSR